MSAAVSEPLAVRVYDERMREADERGEVTQRQSPRRWRWWSFAAAIVACRSPGDQPPELGSGPPPSGSAQAPATERLPTVDDRAELGTADPVTLVASAKNGRWVVACQARADTDGKNGISVTRDIDRLGGDRLVPFVFRGGGPGEPIDALLATSQDDRWLAILRDDQLVLVDDARGTRSIIPDADVRPDRSGVSHLAAFDPESKRLLYLHRAGDARTVVLRDLAEQRVTDIALPPAAEVQLMPGRAERWTQLRYIVRAPPADVATDARARRDDARGQTCGGETRYRGDSLAHDEVTRDVWLDTETARVRDDPTIIGFLGEDEIVQAADKTVRVAQREVVRGACDAQILAVSADSLRVVAACGAGTAHTSIELFGPGVHVVLSHRQGEPREPPIPRVLATPYVCLAHVQCFRLEDGQLIAIHGYPYLDDARQLLTRDRGEFFVTDTATLRTERLPGVSGTLAARAGNVVAIGTHVVDLRQARVLGELPAPPVAVDVTGKALLASAARKGEIAVGPLRWIAASAAAP